MCILFLVVSVGPMGMTVLGEFFPSGDPLCSVSGFRAYCWAAIFVLWGVRVVKGREGFCDGGVGLLFCGGGSPFGCRVCAVSVCVG